MIATQRREHNLRRGFTLIELLVVIAIIGVLSSVVLASLNSARLKARDAKRMSDIKEMQTALELYYDDHQHYPIFTGWQLSNNTTQWNNVGSALASYMSSLPTDPLNAGTTGPWVTGNYVYTYRSDSTGSVYDLLAQLENPSDGNNCAAKGWLYHLGGERPWCSPWPNHYSYSQYIFADH